MDIVAITESLRPVTDWIAKNWPILAIAISCYVLFRWSRGFWGRVAQTIEKLAFSNWQLALLASTGIVLSLASGWTTWDGMRNFTNEPLLSLMITFGIQGVMLIVAWLIGESFASGMNVNRSLRGDRGGQGLEWVAGALLGIFVVAACVIALLNTDTPLLSRDQIIYGLVAATVIALIAILQGDLLAPYLRSTKIIIRNAVLWVMFLSCMATSVFFSFDSLFSTIFPQEERVRAAELRAQNQVAGIVSDIGQTIATRRLEQAEALFTSEGWLTYQTELDELAGKAQGAQQAIEKYFVEKMEERRRAVAEQQERQASAKAQQAGLQSKSIQLNEEISRLQAQRPEAAASVTAQRQVVLEIERRLDEQRAKVLAEEKGVEGTGKVGRGSQWRLERAAEAKIRAELQVANQRLDSPRSRMLGIDKRISTIKAELSLIEGQLAQLKGEAQTAEQRIRATQITTGLEEEAMKVDPARVLPAFERAKVAFRQEPTVERLNNLQQQCTQLLGAMLATPSTKQSVRKIDCDPKAASEAATGVFALNQGVTAFGANCASGENLEKQGSTDALFGFARKCLADSGLPSADTDELRTKINLAELNRDDKAHRFVVTWNAFTDGNRLAYLALAIAIAIDALVFMSGLFGANAIRSPLQDVPRHQPRSAQQLESVMEAALQPHPYEAAHSVIEAMHPIAAESGYTQEIILPQQATSNRAAVAKVLNAGATIGAVTRDEYNPARYLIRPELFEFLSIIARRHYEADKDHRRLAELKRLITVALQPHVGDHAEVILHNMHPINENGDLTSEVRLREVEPEQVPIVRRSLNAGSVLSYVVPDRRPGEEDRFYVHKDLYKTLCIIAAANPTTGTWLNDRPLLGGAGNPQSADLTPAPKQVDAPRTQLLSDQSDAPYDAPSPEHVNKPNAQQNLGVADTDREPDDYRAYFEGQFLTTLGFEDPEHIRHRLAADGVRSAAMDAWKVLKHHCNQNRHLDELVNAFAYDRDKAFSKKHSDLRSEIGSHHQSATDLLERVMSEVSQLLPVLFLFPELGLIPYLIGELEQVHQDGRELNQSEQLLLQRLRAVDSIIRQVDLGDAAAWQQIKDTLAGWDGSDRGPPSRKTDGNSGGV
jgi:hypothetical protein